MRNKLIKLSALIALTAWLLSACALDSDSFVPTIVCVLSGLYFVAISYANDFWGWKNGG